MDTEKDPGKVRHISGEIHHSCIIFGVQLRVNTALASKL
jgi:hypothetical protein